jgi:peptide/nickel transport system substrate-binding protein
MRRLLFATASLAALSFGSLQGFAQDAPTQTLRIAIAEDGDVLDPSVARTFVGRIVFAGLCDKLFDINEKLDIVPQLATGFEYTDPKTLIIKLRAGVKFHDGTDMDAAAVKYSLERHVNFPGSTRKAELAAMDKIEVVDPLTIRILLKSPSAPFVAQLTDRAGMIVSAKAAEAAGKDFGLKPVCSGPFKFVERVAQDRITLERFPEYWDAKNVHFARVIYTIIVDNSVKLANLQAGAVDIAERVAPTDVDAARKDPKLNVMVFPSLGFQSLNINVGNGPKSKLPLGSSKLVRQAFEASIDRSALMQVVTNGLFPPTAQAIPLASPFYNASLKVPERDVAKAKALLAQAGVKLPVAITLNVTTSPDQKQVGEVIQSMASEAGFDVKVQATEFASMLSAEGSGDFEVTGIGWSGRVDPDGNLYSFMYTNAPLNDWKYSNKDVDTWLDEARATTDIPTRKALYAKITNQIHEDLPVLYLDNNAWVTVTNKKLAGFRPVADGMIRIQGMVLAK